MGRYQHAGVRRAQPAGLGTTCAVLMLVMGLAIAASFPLAVHAQEADNETLALTTIAVGISEPGHLGLLNRLVKRYNTRDGEGGIDQRHTVAIIPVDDSETAMLAAETGRADMALAGIDDFDASYGLEDKWARPIAVEVLTIATRRTRLVRDPRQLRGLSVEIPAGRSDKVVERMNQVLGRFGITMPAGTFASAGDLLSREDDPFLRLCRSEYDVRVDMVVHPFSAFSGSLPCELRLMSFPSMPPPTDLGVGVMRFEVASETYNWLNQDITTLGAAVALVQPSDQPGAAAGRDLFIEYLDTLVGREPGLLSAFEANLWLGLDVGAVDDSALGDNAPQESIE
ncbi:MAG: hypothetical protein AAF556_08690 [Pseudomonadota bacterium]